MVGSYGVFQSKVVSKYPWESTDVEFFRKKKEWRSDVSTGRKAAP